MDRLQRISETRLKERRVSGLLSLTSNALRLPLFSVGDHLTG